MKYFKVLFRRAKWWILIFLGVVLLNQIKCMLNRLESRPVLQMPVEDKGQFVKKWAATYKPMFSAINNVPTKQHKIIYWTNFFGIIPDEYVKQQRKCICQYKCELTAERAEFERSDAVMFHLYDTWAENWVLNTSKLVSIPNYRHPRQVWVIVNMEPLGNLWGNFEVLNGLFNWTMTYRADSTLLLPYAQIKKLRSKEYYSSSKFNYYKQKSKAAVARISNCKDYARRYKIIKQVQEYLRVDLFGKCYGKLCGSNSEDPFEENCDDILKEYRFYLALENSFCKDYVTEKYWLSLKREQIPIVNWKHVNRSLVIPHSYINVYDFPDFESFGKYIRSVSSNETLYNSYFEWKENYSYTSECLSCITCRALHEQTAAQTYTNFAGWIKNDFCEDASENNIWWKNYDRYLFDYIDNYH